MIVSDLMKFRVGKNSLHIASACFHEWRCPQCANDDSFIVVSHTIPEITDARTGVKPFIKTDIIRQLKDLRAGRMPEYILGKFKINNKNKADFKSVAQYVASICLETLEPDDIKKIVWAFAWCPCGAMIKLSGKEV